MRANKKRLARIDAAGSPHKRAAAPLCIPCERGGADLVAQKNMEKPPRRLDLTVPSHGSHGRVWTRVAMHVQTKFLRLCEPVSLGDRIDNWRVCWLGGWDKCRVFFIVMVERERELPDPKTQS
jgi:hypothetical protein